MGKTPGIRISALLIINLMANGCGAKGEDESPWAPYNSSMEIVEIIMKPGEGADNIHFYIPEAYFRKYINPYGGREEIISIETGLPSLEPRKAVLHLTMELHGADINIYMKTLRDGLYIDVHNNVLSNSYWNNTENYLKKNYQHISENNYDLQLYQQYMTEKNCTEEYLEKNTEDSQECVPRMKEHYIQRDYKESNSVYITCDGKDHPNWRCLGTISVAGLEVTYSFLRSELFRWKEFDSGVRGLIDRFMTSEPVNEVRNG